MGVAPIETAPVAKPADGATTVTVAALTEAERSAISEAVRAEIRPLRREIAAYREHNDLQSILGGIGYIVGLFGIGFYVAARKKLAA
jgi:nickel transport protein